MQIEYKKTILVADDHNIFRQGLVSQISDSDLFEVIAETGNGAEAFDLINKLKPDLALLDVSMPDMNGLEISQKCLRENSQTEFVVLTMYKEEQYFNKAMDIGIKGYLLKENTFEDLLACLKSVAEGNPYISPLLSMHMIKRKQKMESLRKKAPSLENLTSAERRIIQLIAEYKTSKEIADLLCVSPRTVNNHRGNICRKLGLKGTNSLLQFALDHESIIN